MNNIKRPIAINAGQQRGLQLDPRLGRRGPHRGVHQQWRSTGFHLDLDDVGQGGHDGGDRDGDRGVLVIKVYLLNKGSRKKLFVLGIIPKPADPRPP